MGWRGTEGLSDETDGGDRELLIAGGEMDKSRGWRKRSGQEMRDRKREPCLLLADSSGQLVLLGHMKQGDNEPTGWKYTHNSCWYCFVLFNRYFWTGLVLWSWKKKWNLLYIHWKKISPTQSEYEEQILKILNCVCVSAALWVCFVGGKDLVTLFFYCIFACNVFDPSCRTSQNCLTVLRDVRITCLSLYWRARKWLWCCVAWPFACFNQIYGRVAVIGQRCQIIATLRIGRGTVKHRLCEKWKSHRVVTERGGSFPHLAFPYRIIKPASRISTAILHSCSHITLNYCPLFYNTLQKTKAIEAIVQKILKIAGQHLANPLADERQFKIMSSFAAVICWGSPWMSK